MYQEKIVNIFATEFVLSTFIIFAGFYWLRRKRKEDREQSCGTPVCKSATCKELAPLMKDLIVIRLKFEDDKDQVKKITDHIKLMTEEVHKTTGSVDRDENDDKKYCQEMFQCFCTCSKGGHEKVDSLSGARKR